MHLEPPCQINLRLPGPTLLLRAAWIERPRVVCKGSTDALPSLCILDHFWGMSQITVASRFSCDDHAGAGKKAATPREWSRSDKGLVQSERVRGQALFRMPRLHS